MTFTRIQLWRCLAIAIGLTLSACAGKRNGGGFDDGGGGGFDPYPNPDSGIYVDEIPLTERREGVNFYGANVNRNVIAPIYFGFDQYVISGSEMQKVQQAASYLRGQGQGMSLILAGHTDEVGTSEYNRNLGELRALAVRGALSQMGIDAGRVQTVSFGEDRPAQAGNDSANRRVELGFYR